jgi:hypothetical protein
MLMAFESTAVFVNCPIFARHRDEFAGSKKAVVGQFEVRSTIALQVKTLVNLVCSTSHSCSVGMRCLVTKLCPPQGLALALGRNRSVYSCVLPLLVASLARS